MRENGFWLLPRDLSIQPRNVFDPIKKAFARGIWPVIEEPV